MLCVILQPSFVPWRGFFDLIHRADVFVFYDDVQFDRGGWRQRNRIKTERGTEWISVPIHTRGHLANATQIMDVAIVSGSSWTRSLRDKIRQSYRRAPFFEQYEPLLDDIFNPKYENLAELTIDSTIRIARELGIEKTRFVRSSALGVGGKKTDRLIGVLQAVGADSYLSGPSARDYIEPELFRNAGIDLQYIDYDYPEYPQLYPPFDPQVSILDLLFMTGPEASSYIWREVPAR